MEQNENDGQNLEVDTEQNPVEIGFDQESFDLNNIDKYTEQLMDWCVIFIPKLIMAGLVFMIGFWIVKRISAFIQGNLGKANISTEVTSFLASIIDMALKFAVILFAASILGFQVSSLMALIAAVGFAVGMALQGFLGNFASGITIVFLKPYKLGEWVEISDKFGKVEAIEIFSTTIVTPNHKTLIIPNGQVMENIITNFSAKGHIRLELEVTMPYEESYPRVQEIINTALKTAPHIIQERDVQLGIVNYDSHNITIAIRPFINPDDYWDATYDIYSRIKDAFSANGVKVAYSEGVELGPIGN